MLGTVLGPQFYIPGKVLAKQAFESSIASRDINIQNNLTVAIERTCLSTTSGNWFSLCSTLDGLKSSPANATITYASLLTRGSSDVASIFDAIGHMYCLGHSVALEEVNGLGPQVPKRCQILTNLPDYPFDHSNLYWQRNGTSKASRLSVKAKMDFLGKLMLTMPPTSLSQTSIEDFSPPGRRKAWRISGFGSKAFVRKVTAQKAQRCSVI